jgi:hypothetical protein
MTCERWQDTEVAPDRTHHLHGGGPLYTARFDEVLKFHAPGLAAVRCGDEAWHVDLNGMPAYGLRFRRTFGFYEGLAAVAADDGWRHILPDGTELSTARYAWCGNFQSGLCAVRTTSGEYFHIDSSGHPAYAERWRYAGDYRDGFAVIQRSDGMSTHIDRGGRTLHGRWFVDLDVFHKGYARARDDSGWFHVDAQGHPVYARRFAMAEPFYNGQARVETLDGGLEVISEKGLTLVRLRDDKVLSEAHRLYKQGKFDEALKLNQPGPFEKLTPLSQDDLVQADIAYSGPVDDLSRSLLLMTTVVERECRCTKCCRPWQSAETGSSCRPHAR